MKMTIFLPFDKKSKFNAKLLIIIIEFVIGTVHEIQKYEKKFFLLDKNIIYLGVKIQLKRVSIWLWILTRPKKSIRTAMQSSK